MTKTVIQIDVDTRKELVSIGKKSESYDDIIKRLLVIYNKERGITKK